MGNHAGTPEIEFLDQVNDVDEVIVTPDMLEDGDRPFLTGTRAPGSILVETDDGAAYHIAVDPYRVIVQGLTRTANNSFVPDGDAPLEVTEGTLTGIHTPAEGKRRKNPFVGAFDLTVLPDVISIFADDTTLRVTAPHDYFMNAKK